MDKFLTKKRFLEVDLENLPADPAKRPKIIDYHPNDRDAIRRAYLLKGPCQPREHEFPKKKSLDLYDYSTTENTVFCLYCYLMRYELGEQGSRGAFVSTGYSNWKDISRLYTHVGEVNSIHNTSYRKCQALMNQQQHIDAAIIKQSEQAKKEYRIHLTVVIDCIRFLLHQGLSFRGHDESKNSSNRGNFLELLEFLGNHNETIGQIITKARGNLKLTSSDIQKDIICAVASEITKVIVYDLEDDFFAILIDESRDISAKEQMVVTLRYVDKKGQVMERILGLVHVSDTSALSLKRAFESLFAKHGLSLSKIRGQGYNGASNMQGEYNGLKSLILNENLCAFYVHCFAQQLQLALVAVAKNQIEIASLFNLIASLSNVVGASCKRRDILREKQLYKVVEELHNGEISSGRGLNQEPTLRRAGDTQWGSHYGTLASLIAMFSSVIDVLEIIEEDGANSEQRAEPCSLLNSTQSFEFVFTLHLMKNILGITNEFCQSLQRKDQDIRLQSMREDGWDLLLNEVSLFSGKQNIIVPDMNDIFVAQGRSRRKAIPVSNLHHFQVELFYQVIDRQLQELNNRFTEVNTKLLLCVACLNPSDLFSVFDNQKLISLAQFYPSDFSSIELIILDNQLENYIVDVRSDIRFSELKGMGELSKKLVETRKHIVYPLVYLLLKLALILPVTTATVERSFSAMNIIKSRLRNRMGDDLLNDCLIAFIEKDVFNSIDNEKVIQHFQNMKTRREQVSSI
ncbi:hypothetical protein K2173_021020 [Erythroxylum novogranatense]|uniref:TTF-type domain-containing protein n=1 Tax=Erythroxylum novogranatense TaxID=1862640 RepID=A0AAV8TPB0_9ROSI|nr:hypothetical protein K2173_021020 [Erythroxylum novogranatense]